MAIDTDKLTEYVKQVRNDPVSLLEYLIGRKLSFCEKVIFKVRWKFQNKYSDSHNALWVISRAWNKL